MVSPTRTTRSLRASGTGVHPTVDTAPAPAPAEAQNLVVLGRYRLCRRLGVGGFGTVWHARDERLERDVAVKLLPRERIVGGRFEREARVAARLSHPGIVTLYEAAVDDEGAYLVSELVRGATVARVLEAGRLSDRNIVQIGIALCDALEHAHAQGVIHRDVKPSNVLVPERPASPGQVARLTDFGVARVIGGDTLTRTGDVVGTAAYMAPEQAEGREVGAVADLYSLALVLYEALTGVNPIAVGGAARRARRLGAHLPPCRRQRRDLPRELGRAIDLALRPRPRERGSVDELRAGLLASVEAVEDHPGVVASSRLARIAASSREPRRDPDRADAAFAEPALGRADADRADAVAHSPGAARDTRRRLRVPDRVLAGLAAGMIAAWLAARILPSAPLSPATAGLLACLMVAALPRLGWFALALGAGGTLAAGHRPGAALVVALAAFVPPVLLTRHKERWPLAAIAPGLGAVSLAGAWPAVAARASSTWQRAALGATGWTWTALAGLLVGRGLYTRLPAGTQPATSWMGSVGKTFNHGLAPLLSAGLLAPALAWALAAALLPPITRRSAPVQVVLVTVWSAALASSTTTILRFAHSSGLIRNEAVVLGAVAAAIVAVTPGLMGRWRAGPVTPTLPADSRSMKSPLKPPPRRSC